MHQRAHLPKAKVSHLCSKETGTKFHIDARPRGSSAKNIVGQSFRFAVFDLGKRWKATIMGNPDRFVDHFKHCNTVDVGLGATSTGSSQQQV